jgi:hypothetical protein
MILLFLIIILFIIIFFYLYILKSKKIDKIIHPSDYRIISDKIFYNKFEHSEKILRDIGTKDELVNKLRNIREKTGKNIVYGIKNKDGKYRIEIYLYSKNITEYNYKNIDIDKFKNDLKIILNEFNKEYNNNIDNLFNTYNIVLISFDFDINDSSFNNKLHLYEGKNINTNHNYTYDIDTDSIKVESRYKRIYNYEELYKTLLDYKMNCEEFIKELKEISPYPENMMFHHKYYNNSIGVYLMKNNSTLLEKFINRYNFSIKLPKEQDLIFDIAVNYDLNENKINGVGFSDYF